MSNTIDDFRNFFKQNKQTVNFCVNDVIDEILNMTRGIYNHDTIELRFTHQEKFFTLGYPNEFGQAILNIIANAKDALNELEPKKKWIHIKLYDNGTNIVISIEDNAKGIPETIIDKIYDPYFSTKEKKNGTGLGLYMTKMIIEEKLKGKLSVENSFNGACFYIYLTKAPYLA